MKKVSEALTAIVESAMVSSGDKAQVQALLQAQTSEDDLDLQPAGAPDPASYKSKSGGIVDTLEDMLEKAKGELGDAQKAEMNSKFDYDMLKQKLEDAMAFGTKELDETKAAKAAAEEAKATGENDLAVAEKTVADSISLLAQRIEAASMMGEDPFAKIKGLISE